MKLLQLLTNLITITLLVVTTHIMKGLFIQPIEKPTHVHKTLLLDRNFSPDEVELITMAAIEWTEATNHVAELDVIQLPNDDEMLTHESVVLVHASPDNPNILMQEAIVGNVALGLFTTSSGIASIEIVASRIPEDKYKEVVLHELGHALGLDHITGVEGIGTLMSPYIELGADHITPMDLALFCKKYQCKSKN